MFASVLATCIPSFIFLPGILNYRTLAFLGWFVSSFLKGKTILLVKGSLISSWGKHWHFGEVSSHLSSFIVWSLHLFLSFWLPLYALMWRAKTRSRCSILIWFFFSVVICIEGRLGQLTVQCKLNIRTLTWSERFFSDRKIPLFTEHTQILGFKDVNTFLPREN